MQNVKKYDIVVIGAGVAGGSLSLCLAKAGLKTLTVELKQHPRFTIGESTVPTTTLTFRHIGETYGVPELAGMTNYCELVKITDKVNTFAKTHFWFGVHKEGQKLQPNHETMFETFAPPMGPDTHLMRADLDSFLVSLFPKYGVDYMNYTSVKEFKADDKTGIDLVLVTRLEGQEEKTTLVHADFAVDCTGHSAFLSRKFGYLQKEPKLHTRTRTIYGHFEYDSVLFDLDRIMGGPNPSFRFNRTNGTGHHCFDGGWIWVIPFDNNTVSIGIVLNVDKYPLDQNISKEDEFQAVVNRYPTIKEHFQHLRPIGELRRGNRMQLRSDTILGPRFILTPHASNFVDPLFSTGIMMTARFIARFMPVIKKCFEVRNFDRELFRTIETNTFRELKHIDYLVSGVIESYHNYDVFKQFWRLWVESSYRQVVDTTAFNIPCCPLFGSHDESFYRMLKQCWKLVFSLQCRQNPPLIAAQLKTIIDANKDSKIPKYEYILDDPMACGVLNYPRSREEVTFFAYPTAKNGLKVAYVILKFIFGYFISVLFGTKYCKSVERVFRARTPGNKNKFDFFSGLPKINRAPYLRDAMPLNKPLSKNFMM